MPVWKKMKQIRKRKTAQGLLEYIFKEKGAELLLTHNLIGDTVGDWVGQYKQRFEDWETKNSRSAEVHHEVISFGKEENKALLTREFLLGIGEKVVELRGTDGMYTVVVHKEKEHWHLHVCVATSSLRTNRELRLGGDKFKGIRIELEDYIRSNYPEIKHSFAYTLDREREKTMRITDGDYRSKKSGREHRKDIVRGIAQKALEKSQTLDQFKRELEANDLMGLIRNEKLTGVIENRGGKEDKAKKIKYRFSTLGLDREYELLLEREINQLKKERSLQLEIDGDRGGRAVEKERSLDRDVTI